MNSKNGNTSDKELIDISSDDEKINEMSMIKDTEVFEVNKRPRKRFLYGNSNEQPKDQANFLSSEVKRFSCKKNTQTKVYTTGRDRTRVIMGM